MASRVSCVRETARQGRPRFVRAFIYLSIYLGGTPVGPGLECMPVVFCITGEE